MIPNHNFFFFFLYFLFYGLSGKEGGEEHAGSSKAWRCPPLAVGSLRNPAGAVFARQEGW